MHVQKSYKEVENRMTKAWSNIEISSQDTEIIQINRLEEKLGKLPEKVLQIRELITRFEVCHFKYQHHIRKIKESIISLEPLTVPSEIGINHIQKGENAWKKDKTGRSKTGQQYLWAIKNWLDNMDQTVYSVHFDQALGQRIAKWLGEKNPNKERLVRLLVSRLTWDWKSYQELQQGGDLKELELQVCRMDICHYAFPANLDLLLQAIGEMKPVKDFEGCGSFDAKIRAFIEKEHSALRELLQTVIDRGQSENNELIKAWLFACLIKTIKEQVHLSDHSMNN